MFKQNTPGEVVGHPMPVVVHSTLTPRDQTLNYTENERPGSVSWASCWNHRQFSSLSLARREAKARELRDCCCGSPADYLRGMWGCVAVLAVGCVLSTAVLMWYHASALTSWTSWIVTVLAFDLGDDFKSLPFISWQSDVDRFFFRNPKNEGEHVWNRHQSAPC